jgi:hypothetical protein
MNRTADISTEQVPSEEVERRVEEYRQLGYLRRLPAQVVYPESQWKCPWAGCSFAIAAIHFQIEKMAGTDTQDRLLDAWWKGQGLVGKCPSCNRYVLYGLREKRAIEDSTSVSEALMPEQWQEIAHLVTRPLKDNRRA